MDDIDVAVLAKRKGMRGLVLKNHVTMTADRAVLVMKTVPGIEIFGGIVLNNAVGGINPAAVEWMHRMSGGRGKVVWLPTFDSDKHIKTLVDPEGLRHRRRAERRRDAAARRSPEDHRAGKPGARDRAHPRRGSDGRGQARKGTRREEHPHHPRADQHSRPVHGTGQAGRADGRLHRVLLPAVDDRAGRAARLDEALEQGVAQGRGKSGRRNRRAARGACPPTSASTPT